MDIEVRFQLQRFIAAEFLPSSCTSSCFFAKKSKQRGLLKLQLTIQTSQMFKTYMSWQACDTFDRRDVNSMFIHFRILYLRNLSINLSWNDVEQSVSVSWGYFFCSYQMKFTHHDIGIYTLWVASLCLFLCIYSIINTRLGNKEQTGAAPKHLVSSTTMGFTTPRGPEVAFSSLRSGSATFRCLSECRGCLDLSMREPREISPRNSVMFC